MIRTMYSFGVGAGVNGEGSMFEKVVRKEYGMLVWERIRDIGMKRECGIPV